MANFIETPRFPENISYGSSGGPEYNTTVVGLYSGYEQRIANFTNPLHKYNVGYGIKLKDDLEVVLQYFHVVAGRFLAFRYKDWQDFKSCAVFNTPAADDQLLGTGDSTTGSDGTADYDLIKTYSFGASTYDRPIYKPVDGTLLVAVDGVAKTEGVHYNIDLTLGRITFTNGNHPLAGLDVTAGFEFDVPVRFNSDMLDISQDFYHGGSLRIELKEIRISR